MYIYAVYNISKNIFNMYIMYIVVFLYNITLEVFCFLAVSVRNTFGGSPFVKFGLQHSGHETKTQEVQIHV